MRRLLASIIAAAAVLAGLLTIGTPSQNSGPAPVRATLTAVVQPTISAEAAHAAHLAHLAHLARVGQSTAHATLMSSVSSPGDRLLNAAETRTGDWYSYGAAGPNYFDCSGLVYWAARQIGISLPRTTYSMLGSSHLIRIPVNGAPRGSLMFYGSGHVEIMTAWYHTTFGAQHSGTRVGWHVWNSYWAPTMAFRLR